MGDRVELVAGSYEQIVFGYRICTGEKEWTLEPNFTHHAHAASLSAVASNDQFIATGSKDETIQLYDMSKKTEYGSLLHHDGTISCLEFYSSSHLLSGGEDGLICVWSTQKWECLKSIKAHKGHVKSLSVHPSGKLALSVGTDKTLRTWNLIEGRSAFIKNIKQNAEIVLWSPDGDKYAVVVNDRVDIYILESATVIGTIAFQKRITCLNFLNNMLLAVAEMMTVCVYMTSPHRSAFMKFKHENRVKAMQSFVKDYFHVLVTASNDGFIKMWKLNLENLETPSLLGEINTTARLTCLSVWKPGKEPSAQTATSKTVVESPMPAKGKSVRIKTEEVIIQEESSSMKRGKKTKRQKVQ